MANNWHWEEINPIQHIELYIMSRNCFSYSDYYLLCSHLCIPKCKLTDTSYLVFPKALSDWSISSILLSALWKATTVPQPAVIHQYLQKSSLIPVMHGKCSYFGALKYYYKNLQGITIRKRNKNKFHLINFCDLLKCECLTLNDFYFFGKFINSIY